MLFHYEEKNISKKLREAETAELEAYCKQQGYTKEQTEAFIKNSLAKSEEEYLGE